MSYLAVLSPFLKRRCRLIGKCGNISSFEHLIIFLRFAELDVHLYSPSAKFLYSVVQSKARWHICNYSPWENKNVILNVARKLTVASLPLFLNLFRRATFSDIFGLQEGLAAVKLSLVVLYLLDTTLKTHILRAASWWRDRVMQTFNLIDTFVFWWLYYLLVMQEA